MRSKACIDVLTSLEQAGSLMMYAALEHSVGVVASKGTFQALRKIGLLGQGIDINSMEEVSSIVKTSDIW